MDKNMQKLYHISITSFPVFFNVSSLPLLHYYLITVSEPDQICAFSALTLLVGRQEGHLACTKLSGGMLARLFVCRDVQICIWPS